MGYWFLSDPNLFIKSSLYLISLLNEEIGKDAISSLMRFHGK